MHGSLFLIKEYLFFFMLALRLESYWQNVQLRKGLFKLYFFLFFFEIANMFKY